LDLENLLTPIFEPINGLYTCIGPIGRLDTSKWSMFVLANFFLGEKKVSKDWRTSECSESPLEMLLLELRV